MQHKLKAVKKYIDTSTTVRQCVIFYQYCSQPISPMFVTRNKKSLIISFSTKCEKLIILRKLRICMSFGVVRL